MTERSNEKPHDALESSPTDVRAARLKFCIYSAIGMFMFFVPITLGGVSTIPLDHLVTAIRAGLPSLVPIYALVIIVIGAGYPLVTGNWNRDRVSVVFSVLKLVGVPVALMMYFGVGPAWLFEPSMGPFLFDKLVIPVGILVPLGAVFLALLVNFGFLEFIGVLFQPIMKPVWRTPGRSAVDAVASFVGSYSIGLLITNRVFKEGMYTGREACIIATGFSTVSATFMIVVARTLDLMEMWTLYFVVTMIVTFLVTAITVRMPPLSRKPTDYHPGSEGRPQQRAEGPLLKAAWHEGIEAARKSPTLGASIVDNVKDGLIMVMAILPTILSVGLIGLILAEYTPVFDILSYLFLPFTWALQLPEPALAAKASAVGIAEMFLPALVAAEAPLVTRFVIGVVCVSQILFFSASVPCILSTEIPLTIADILILWVQRVILTLLIATPIAFALL